LHGVCLSVWYLKIELIGGSQLHSFLLPMKLALMAFDIFQCPVQYHNYYALLKINITLKTEIIIKQRNSFQVIRYVRFNKKTDSENFYIERLVLFYPWRNETTHLNKQFLSGDEFFNRNVLLSGREVLINTTFLVAFVKGSWSVKYAASWAQGNHMKYESTHTWRLFCQLGKLIMIYNLYWIHMLVQCI
jgi:hypothetical protein